MIIRMYILCTVHSCITNHFHSVLTYDSVCAGEQTGPAWETGLGAEGRNCRQALTNEAWRSLTNADRKGNTVVRLSCF